MGIGDKGMARRASASSTVPPTAATATASRVHRSNESHHGFVGTHPTNAGLPGYTPGGAAGSPQGKVVLALIRRLTEKLPFYCGLPLTDVESDPAVMLIIESLVELAHNALDIIVWKLSEELEKLAKMTDLIGERAVAILQSELFLLKVMSVTLAYKWQHRKAPRKVAHAAIPTPQTNANGSATTPSSSVNSLPHHHDSAAAFYKRSHPSVSSGSQEYIASGSLWLEAPPLDEACAKWLVSVMILLLRQAAPRDDRAKSYANLSTDASLYGFESIENSESIWSLNDQILRMPELPSAPPPPPVASPVTGLDTDTLIEGLPRKTPSQSSISSDSTASIPLPRSSLGFQATPRTLMVSTEPLYNLLHRWTGHIIYLLSSANWPVVLSRIRTKIHQLAKAGPSEDILDTTDLQLLQHVALDRTRLVQVMQELSSLLVNMRREAQEAVAINLRRSIWNWIEIFPNEFIDVAKGKRRLDGAPERVFDLFYQANEDAYKRNIMPTLTALLLLCHDRTNQIARNASQKGQGKATKKEFLFLDQLRKMMSPSSKVADVGLLCYVDICRAAAYTPPESDIPLRSAAVEVADLIKERLWKGINQRPFFDSPDPIDVALYADALVSLVHFLPLDEAIDIIESCLEAERSDAVKMCAVKAYVVLMQQAEKWPWHLSPTTLWERIGPRIWSIFRATASRRNEVDKYGVVRRSSPNPVAKRYSSESIADKELLMYAVLACYRIDPRCVLYNVTEERMEAWLVDCVSLVFRPGDIGLPQSALRSMKFAVQWIVPLQPGEEFFDEARIFLGMLVPSLLAASASRLLDERDNVDEQRMAVEMGNNVVMLYQISLHTDLAKTWEMPDGRLPAMVVAEMAFLVSLTSSDGKVVTGAARGLREIALAEGPGRIAREESDEPDETAKRFPVYEQLGDPTEMTIGGRIAHQKRIRKLLRLLTNPTALHAAVWHECFWRWSALTDIVNRRSLDGSSLDGHSINLNQRPNGDRTMTPQERLQQWQNLTLFLASFGAVTLLDQQPGKEITAVVPVKNLPDRFRTMQDGELLLQTFIERTVDYLIADSLYSRDCAKEALGQELHPKLYGMLFRRLNLVVEDVTKATKEIDSHKQEEMLVVFFEQFLAVLKLLVDRADSPSDDVLGNADLSQTLLALTSFIERFTESSSLRLKIKFCAFCENALARSDAFGLRKDESVRNTLLDIVVEWIQPEIHGQDLPEGSLNRLRHDTNVASLRTVVRLLERLRLQPLENSSGDDATHVVSRRFVRYQNVLLHALKNDSSDLVIPGAKGSTPPSTTTVTNTVETEAEMRDLVISGLAHLLSHNTDIGLKHFLPLGYDIDPNRRAIFCHVVSRVMDLGGRFETSSESVVAGRRTRIGELVKGSDMILVVAICETCPPSEADVITPVLLNLFDTRASLLTLLKLLIEREVKTTTSEQGLFRGNSMRIKVLGAFAKQHGYDYLRKLVKPLLDKMFNMAKESGQTFILEVEKSSEEEVHDNQETIKMFTQAFLNIVCNSAPGMPLMLREICAHIAQTVSEVWPEAKFAALGAFIFLRFISPALVAPETIDVELPPDNAHIRRGLLHITKIIQNLANNVRFGKEAHMMCFNDFLSSNIVRVMRFLTDVNKFANASAEEDDEWVGGTFDETDAIVLHRFFERHADKVGKELLSLAKSSKESETGVVGGKRAWDTLCAALVDMGQPVDIPQLTQLTTSTFDEYREFMMRNDERSTESVSDLFSEVATNKEDIVLFLLSIEKFDIEVLDFELLVYHVFKLLTSPNNVEKDFEVVLDCTNYTTASEIPMQWFKFFVELTPYDLRVRFRTIRILNCNLHMQRFLRKLYNICSGIYSVEIKTHFSLEQLCDAVHTNLTLALGNAWALEQETRESFNDVMLRQAHLPKSPVNLFVAQSHLRIDSVKAQSVYPGLNSRSSEIVPYSDVGDIYNVSTGRDANEFIIRRSRNGGTLYFSSPEREQIIKAIRTAKSRMNTGRAVFFDRFSRLSNVSAALLNIAMFNTYQENADLRSAAYSLLTAVCSSLSYDAESFLPSSGGFIPGRPVTHITQLSEKLANFAPQLTLDFISQVCIELDKSAAHQKAICLQYMNPWLKNFNKFCDPTNKLFELSGARLRDCIRLLLDLTVKDGDAYYIMQKYTWSEIGTLDSAVVNIVLDEIMRFAVDGGIGSPRCEMMADTVSSMSSLNARGRILAKLRKALGKTSTKPSKTLDSNVHWNEIVTYARLALGSGTSVNHGVQNTLLVPEVIHLVTLLAAQGKLFVRTTVYGLALQLFQSLYAMHEEDATLASEVRNILNEISSPATIRLFGLEQVSKTSEYTAVEVDPSEDRETLEKLSRWLLQAVVTCSGSIGLANIWRSRWMGLLTATAFQLSPSIQPRAFVVMGVLASSDVDDDLLYQMLVALRSSMKTADEKDTQCVVSMIHCVCNAVPSLPESSRYVGSLFWLAVALLQSSHAPFYTSATRLMCACLRTLLAQGAFKERGFTETLLDYRSNLEDISRQLDQLLGMSFDSDFSFSLAAVMVKGFRRPDYRASATEALRCLLCTAVATFAKTEEVDAVVHPDILGYFIALLSVSTTPQTYIRLLQEANVGSVWFPKRDSIGRFDYDSDQVPRPSFDVLGCTDSTSALFSISFIATILSTAPRDDPEAQVLFSLLKDASQPYPDIVSMAYEGITEKVYEVFSHSANASTLSSASAVFRVAMDDESRSMATRGSTTTLSTVEEDAALASKEKHKQALEDLNMQGLANTFQFLSPNKGHVTKVLNWFPELISKIIE